MIRKFPLLAFVLVSFGAAPYACAEQRDEPTPVYVDAATGLKYPRKVGPLDFVNLVEYPEKSLGYCVRYSSPRDYGQLCVYDQGKKNLQTGLGSEDFKNEFDRAVEATLAYLSILPYHDGKVLAGGTPSIGTDEKVAEAKMKILASKMTMPDGSDQNNTHMILMSVGLGRFVKFNYTAKNMSPADFAQRSREIVEAFVRFNGATMKAFLVDRKGKAE
jgi:hypothetical protein